jgi:hypothetical protein
MNPLCSRYLIVHCAQVEAAAAAQASKLSRNIKGEEDSPNMVFHGCILLHQSSIMVEFSS